MSSTHVARSCVLAAVVLMALMEVCIVAYVAVTVDVPRALIVAVVLTTFDVVMLLRVAYQIAGRGGRP